MRKKNYKGRCEKLSVSKSKDVCRMYSELQKKYLYKLQDNEHIRVFISFVTFIERRKNCKHIIFLEME